MARPISLDRMRRGSSEEVALVRNLLTPFYSSPHTFGGKVGEVSQRILFGRAPLLLLLRVRGRAAGWASGRPCHAGSIRHMLA
jgi:hypothetical protein